MTFSPEFELMLLCSKSHPSQSDIQRMKACLDSPFDFDQFINLVENHRLCSPVHETVKHHLGEKMPETQIRRLEDLNRKNILKSLKNIAATVAVSKAFEENGVRHIFLKGACLGQYLYGSTANRHAGDIDVLIDENQFSSAAAALDSLSYKQVEPRFQFTPETLSGYKRLYHHVTYRSLLNNTHVELHWRFSSVHRLFPLTFGEALSACQSISLGGRPIPFLSDHHNLLYLFCHGANHSWRRLFWLKDIDDGLAKVPGIHLPELIHIAQARHVTNYILEGLYLLNHYFKTPLPESVEQLINKSWYIKCVGRIPYRTHSQEGSYTVRTALRKIHSLLIKQSVKIRYAFLKRQLMVLGIKIKSL